MCHAMQRQRRLDCDSVSQVVLNLNCRDELIPILRGLQQVYVTSQVREAILKLVERDVLAKSRSDRGREGLNYWCVLVLAAVRLGCNLDYDKRHDLAENHRALRSIRGISEFDETPFSIATPTRGTPAPATDVVAGLSAITAWPSPRLESSGLQLPGLALVMSAQRDRSL